MQKKSLVKSFFCILIRRRLMVCYGLTIVFLIGLTFNASALTLSQDATVSLSFDKATIKNVFNEIRKQTNYAFLYSKDVIDDSKQIKAHFKNEKLSTVMDKLFGEKYDISYDGNIVIISPKTIKDKKKKKQVKGSILDEKGKPMPGVTVILKGTSMGTITDAEGKFKFSIPMNKGFLVVTFIGYNKQEIPFKEGDDLKIKMKVKRSNLDEVKVTAYGKTTRRKSTSAISTVKGEDLKGVPTANLSTLLQGKVAGLEISNVSGAPGGGGTYVTLRGFNSMLVNQGTRGSEPLWVIDGIPMPNITSPVTGTNALTEIDPQSIESVEILKDAASCALYGSRAANGVILITTKKGRKGDAKFSVNFSKTFSWIPQYPEVMGGIAEREYRTALMRNSRTSYYNEELDRYMYPQNHFEAYKNNATYDAFWGINNRNAVSYLYQDSLNSYYNNSTDWFQYFFDRGSIINGNIQATGGSDKFLYSVGLNYFDEEGILIGTGFSKINLLANITMKPIRNLTLNLRNSFTYSDRNRMHSDSPYGSGTFQEVERIPGNPFKLSTLLVHDGSQHDAILATLQGVKSKYENHSFRSSLDLQYKITKDFLIKSSLSYSFVEANANVFSPSSMSSYNEAKTTGDISRGTMILNENLLNYNINIDDIHEIELLAGSTYQKNKNNAWTGTAIGSPSDYVEYSVKGFPTLLDRGYMTEAAQSYRSDFTERIMVSFLGRINYNYKKKYLLGATIRRDGSSTFGKNCKWANFPSLSCGWAFSTENFMRWATWLDFGKIRASWGRTGQVFAQPYLSYGLLTVASTFDNKATVSPKWKDGLYNPDLTWEKTSQYDLGLDIDIFNYRANITLDYYLRQTTGMLYATNVLGDFYTYGSQWKNACGIDNEGLELLVKVDVFRDTDFKWTTSVNIAKNWNKFKESFNGKDIIGNSNFIIGKPLFAILGKKTDGFYNANSEVPMVYNASYSKRYLYPAYHPENHYIAGDVKYIDMNGDNQINASDNIYLGSSLPKVHGGIVNSFKYKGFELNAQMVYSIGRTIINGRYASPLSSGKQGSPIFCDTRDLIWWNGSNTDANMPRQALDQDRGNFNVYSDRFAKKVNYLKLKSISLTYNLPQEICKKCHVRGMQVLLSGNNLFTITNYDGSDPETIPQTSGYDRWNSYPLPRQFTLGLTVNL